jgi:uncharacterized protein YbjT (DUF2867 family)
MYLVTGATGNVGSEVVRALVEVGEPVRALTRDGNPEGLPYGVDVQPGDLTDPKSLAAAFIGVKGIFALPGYPGVVTAAVESGITTVVQLSGTSVQTQDRANPISAFMMDSEDEVRASHARWTILRPYDFMANTLRWQPQLAHGDVVREPFADVPVAMIDPYDIAAVAALALTSDSIDGEVYTLSGPELLLPADRVRILGEVLGRPLALEPLGNDEARTLLSMQQPAKYVDAMFDFYVKGTIDVSHVLPTVDQLLGRPSRTFRDWALAHQAAFTPAA